MVTQTMHPPYEDALDMTRLIQYVLLTQHTNLTSDHEIVNLRMIKQCAYVGKCLIGNPKDCIGTIVILRTPEYYLEC